MGVVGLPFAEFVFEKGRGENEHEPLSKVTEFHSRGY